MAPEKQDSTFMLTALTCPITLELFVDPVLADDGHTYERSAIVDWIKNHNATSPMTRQPMKLKELKTNRVVKQLADQYRASIKPDIGKQLAMFSGDGTLLTKAQKLNINRLFLKDKRWLLIYKATKDGFGASDFHRQCNNRGPTLTLIQTRHRFQMKNHSSTFGGYTTIPWSSRHGSYRDSQSFLFLLSNDKIIRFNLRSPDDIAVTHHFTSGPIFGVDDIHICHRANETYNSFSKFPSSYQVQITNKDGPKTFTKWRHFLVSEMEVYMVVM